MASNSVDIRSFLKGLKLADERVRGGLVKGLNQLGAQLGGDAQDHAPIDKGPLRASETELPAVVTTTSIEKVVGFNQVYAAVQHEGLDFEHPKGGEAKYLENAARRITPKVAPHLAKCVDRELQGGSK